MDNFIKIISTQGMWGAVISTIAFVLIGFFATRYKFLTKEINGKLSKFLLTWILPFLCIGAFMQNANKDMAIQVGIVLGLSIIFYVLFGVLTSVIVRLAPRMVSGRITAKAEELYEKSLQNAEEGAKPDKAAVREKVLDDYKQKIIATQLMLGYGSLQFFAYPLVIALSKGNDAIFGQNALALAQIWCIPYMIGAFSYVSLMFSGEKISKKSVKPIIKSLTSPMMLALYISLVLWALQFIPGLDKKYATVDNKPYQVVTEGGRNFWAAFKVEIPAIGGALNTGTAIVSPLAWIVIGGTLADSDLKSAAKDKDVWITTVRKLVTVPLAIYVLAIAIFAGLVAIGNGKVISKEDAASVATLLVLLAATPPAAVTMIFAVAHKNPHAPYVAQVNSLSTLLALVFMPLWVILAYSTFGPIMNAIVA
ncbi:AEC family transporter [Mycoplasmopsis primatum]|uniref:AEC family transporter n=1 Tax=Mycoplasmopsis primatum TaxID=55604 RepID=UPI000495F871|nr:AEC family transporter [Mycoplasmopsis primatum]